MATTIQLKNDVKTKLEGFKMHPRESYNEVIERLLEDISQLNAKTRAEMNKARTEIKAGKYKTHEQLGKEMGLD